VLAGCCALAASAAGSSDRCTTAARTRLILTNMSDPAQVCTAKMNLSDEVDLEDYVGRTDKISAAEIASICQEAGMQASAAAGFCFVCAARVAALCVPCRSSLAC
jgi:AAA+ lid domain